MKKLFLLMALVLGSALCQAQTSEPFKKASTILVQTKDSTDVMRRVVQAVTAQGFGVQTVDKELGILTTMAKPSKGGKTVLHIQVSGNMITVQGNFYLPALTVANATYDGPTKIEYRGAANSPLMRAWVEMASVAQAIPNATLSYK
jgi:hypothetical protein